MTSARKTSEVGAVVTLRRGGARSRRGRCPGHPGRRGRPGTWTRVPWHLSSMRNRLPQRMRVKCQAPGLGLRRHSAPGICFRVWHPDRPTCVATGAWDLGPHASSWGAASTVTVRVVLVMSGVCASVQMQLIMRFKSCVRCAFSVSYTAVKLSLQDAEKPFCPVGVAR